MITILTNSEWAKLEASLSPEELRKAKAMIAILNHKGNAYIRQN